MPKPIGKQAPPPKGIGGKLNKEIHVGPLTLPLWGVGAVALGAWWLWFHVIQPYNAANTEGANDTGYGGGQSFAGGGGGGGQTGDATPRHRHRNRTRDHHHRGGHRQHTHRDAIPTRHMQRRPTGGHLGRKDARK